MDKKAADWKSPANPRLDSDDIELATLEFGGQFVPLLQAWTSGTAMKTITITTQNKHFPRQSEHKGIYT